MDNGWAPILLSAWAQPQPPASFTRAGLRFQLLNPQPILQLWCRLSPRACRAGLRFRRTRATRFTSPQLLEPSRRLQHNVNYNVKCSHTWHSRIDEEEKLFEWLNITDIAILHEVFHLGQAPITAPWVPRAYRDASQWEHNDVRSQRE